MSTTSTGDLPLINPVPLTPAIAKRIQARIDALNPDPLKSSATHAFKHVYNALPIAGNSNFMWAIRPDGEVMRMDHVSFQRSCERETDPLQVHAAMASGRLAYVELRAVQPPRPLWTKRCFACSAEGYKVNDAGHAEICLACNGIGWLWRGLAKR